MGLLVVNVVHSQVGDLLSVLISSSLEDLRTFRFSKPGRQSAENKQELERLLDVMINNDLVFCDAALEFNLLRQLYEVNGLGELANVVPAVICLRSWTAETADPSVKECVGALLGNAIVRSDGAEKSAAQAIGSFWTCYQTLARSG